ncbi:MAG: hypothetical protein KDD43_17055 [Bdellovibrionales bacterium]|nr:hypothetical protein [Bdellovibrionales bacterium]
MFWNRFDGRGPLVVIAPNSGHHGRPCFEEHFESRHGHVTYLFFPHAVWLNDRKTCREFARVVARKHSQSKVVLLHHKLGDLPYDRAVVRFVNTLRKQGVLPSKMHVMTKEKPLSGPLARLFNTRVGRKLCLTFAQFHQANSEKCCWSWPKWATQMSTLAARLF